MHRLALILGSGGGNKTNSHKTVRDSVSVGEVATEGMTLYKQEVAGSRHVECPPGQALHGLCLGIYFTSVD